MSDLHTSSTSLAMPGKRFVIGVPFGWLTVFFLLPFLILLYISFVDMGGDIHPFKPLWDSQTGVLHLKYENYWTIFKTDWDGALFQTLYIEAYLRSVVYAFVTACCVCWWGIRLRTSLHAHPLRCAQRC
jgi:putrescine transport system permease protein